MALIGNSGEINPVLIELLNELGIPFEDTSVQGIHKVLQAHCFRKGKKRYEIEGAPPTAEHLVLLRKLGVIDAVPPLDNGGMGYDGALLLGTVLERVRTRLAFLQSCYRQGLNFQNVFLLGSQRKLNVKENEYALVTANPLLPFKADWKPGVLPTTEIEMMKFVVDQSDLPIEWQIIPIETLDVKVLPLGLTTRNANTGDTILTWYEWLGDQRGHPAFLPRDRFLVVSNQPFVTYQETNVRRVCPDQDIIFRGMGDVANVNLPLATYLDNLAKQLYEEIALARRAF